MKNSQVKQKSSKKSQSQSKSQTKSQKSQAKSQQSQHESQTKVKPKSKNCRSHGIKSDKSQGKVKVKVKEKSNPNNLCFFNGSFPAMMLFFIIMSVNKCINDTTEVIYLNKQVQKNK